ncbi:MAG TPA: hypothetical protein VGB17_13240 [Pyrinomonadaceae bacterium]|jgi:hypothetical protein
MLRTSFTRKSLSLVCCCLAALALIVNAASVPARADDLTGRELLSVTRVAHGGADYAGLQNVTVKANGFVNIAAFTGGGGNPLGAAVELKLNLTDVQDKQGRRRLDIAPAGAMIAGPTYFVYTGSEGGGMFSGNPFRVAEIAASRHWAMMGFDTLNRAIEGQLATARQKDEGSDYVVEVKFSPQDTVRYWINKQSFLIDKVVTRYNSKVMIEEERSDYRRAGCMMLPFHVVTRLQGQRVADLALESYDLTSEVPAARFTLSATP